MKYKPQRSEIKTREVAPKVVETKKGTIIECPFCQPSHPILPGVASECGTVLKVTAVQQYLTSHATRNNKIRCLKCGETSGEMIRYRSGFVHMQECKPGTKLLTQIPKMSIVAKVVYKLPAKLRALIEKRTGQVKELQEIDVNGVQTGKILGHFFWKG
jgi:hypothetical protein